MPARTLPAYPATAQSAVDLDWELEECVSKFEEEWTERGEAKIVDFLPAKDHVRFDAVAMELMRVDAELATRAGFMRDLKFYTELLPQVLQREQHRQQLAFELSRLSIGKNSSIQYPRVGETIAGFELLSELGSGAFSRVYLAAENELSRRLVILKFSTKFPGEASTLARLQHKNIVPIYSWHRHNQFHVVCMPYLGATTLWDFLKSYSRFAGRSGGSDVSSKLGQAIVSTVCNRRSQTLAELVKRQSVVSETTSGEATPVHRVVQPPAAANNSGLSTVTQLEQVAPSELEPEQVTSSQTGKDATNETSFAIGLSRETPRLLGSQRNAETILWIGKELAAGLMHAHDRGVLHRDVKPANILLADDGTPMLLDFNLAVFERPQQVESEIGGTPRYMAPEHLRSVSDPKEVIDARSDLYSLGVVLFELTVGRSPFDDVADSWETAIPKMLEQRHVWTASSVNWPRELSPSLIEIISKLLAYDPANRYNSAAALYEDLERELTHRPLKHARNRSIAERARKWALRHPRLSSAAVVSSVLGAVILGAILLLVWRQLEVQQLQSARWLSELEKAQLPAQAIFGSSSLPTEQVSEMLKDSDELVASPVVLSERIAKLDNSERSKASQLAGQLMLFRARGNLRLADHQRDSAQRVAFLNAALRESQAASQFLANGRSANEQLASVIQQQLDGDSPQLHAAIPTIPQEIIDLTQQLLGVDAANPWYWWLIGHRQFVAGDNEAATASAQVARQLDPAFPWSHYLLALIFIDQQKYAQAESQLTKLIDSFELDQTEIFMNRAIARLAQGNASGAKDDLQVIDSEADRFPRIFFLRERAYRLMGDQKAAQAAMKLGLATEPTEGHGYIARADAKLRKTPPDPAGALDDFQRASAMLPYNVAAYENQAFILSEMLGKREQAIEVLTRGMAKLPQQASLLASRATLWGRTRNVEAARADVRAALQLDRSAMICYQAASALLLASDSTDDRTQALDLLKETLRKDPSLKTSMDTDRDLAPLRDSEQFKAVTNAAILFQ